MTRMAVRSILIGLAAVVLAGASVTVEWPVPTVVGNLCAVTTDNPGGHCIEERPAGGWPFAFLYDRGGISVEGRLGLEDRFETWWFLADAAIIAALLTGLGVVRRRSARG